LPQKNLKKEREKIKGLTQEKIAVSCEITLRHYQRIEKYETLPNISLGLKIAKLVNTNPYELWD
jgi:DNA-binding XRE family transcriptional regulator